MKIECQTCLCKFCKNEKCKKLCVSTVKVLLCIAAKQRKYLIKLKQEGE